MTAATIEAEPFGHLTPFVVIIARKRVEAGETITPELMMECLQQAVNEDNARCLRWGVRDGGYESSRRREERAAVVEALSLSVYQSLPQRPEGEPPPYQPDWLRCAAEKGVAPEALQGFEFIIWKHQDNRKRGSNV